jgi:clathrin heavy chain
MVTAATSASTEVAEELLSYFVDIGNKECFSALLFICFDLLRSDIVEELSWQHGLNDFYMPYKIQQQRTHVERVNLFHLCDDSSELIYIADGRSREAG